MGCSSNLCNKLCLPFADNFRVNFKWFLVHDDVCGLGLWCPFLACPAATQVVLRACAPFYSKPATITLHLSAGKQSLLHAAAIEETRDVRRSKRGGVRSRGCSFIVLPGVTRCNRLMWGRGRATGGNALRFVVFIFHLHFTVFAVSCVFSRVYFSVFESFCRETAHPGPKEGDTQPVASRPKFGSS